MENTIRNEREAREARRALTEIDSQRVRLSSRKPILLFQSGENILSVSQGGLYTETPEHRSRLFKLPLTSRYYTLSLFSGVSEVLELYDNINPDTLRKQFRINAGS
ncbi:MAG: hypothetical protein Q8L29_03595 [archaeon]|nr:hypothetical protein [archaeon]